MPRLLITILLVAAGALPALAGDDDATISVTGTATVTIVPDEFVWHLQVRNEGPELPAVVDVHTGRVDQVLRFLAKMDVAEDDMSPSRMSCGENWNHRRGERIREGYYATTRVSFRSGDLDAYVKLWTGLAAIDGVSISSVDYDHSERIRYQDETRRAALRAAREKAADLAAVLDARIGAPLRIVENPDRGVRPYPNPSNVKLMAEGDAGAAASTPGRIELRVSIDAVFRLLPGE
jgi:uncharacterized protein YggE